MDSLWLKVGGLPAPIGVPASGCTELRPSSGLSSQINVGRSSSSSTAAVSLDRRNRSNSPWGISFRFPAIGSLWPKGGGNGKSSYDNALAVDEAAVLAAAEEEEEEQGGNPTENEKGGIFSILNVRIGGEENAVLNDGNGEDGEENDGGDCEVCSVDYCENDDDEKIGFDKDSFTKLLQRVSLAEARLYAQMSGLGNLAYSIPQIKPGNLLKDYGLEFVTSSLEKREQRLKADQEKEKENAEPGESGEERDHSVDKQAQGVEGNGVDGLSIKEERARANKLSAATAYQIAASAASYLHSRTKSILPFQSRSTTDQDMIHMSEGMPSTDSVTAVVAAKEEVKQAVADDLNSVLSSPCEWFICDDDQNATRFFVIQGSESVASWQANLLFEPVQFEGFDVLVHRGIYEAAKGIYEQILPEVHSHLKSHGRRASFRFTGHSLGGSLSMLINLMLLIRGEVPLSSLLPVITFGAPTVMCGGDSLLKKLGLPRSHVKAIAMHRDIVPRAFSCNYPNHIAEILKAVNGKFRTLPCLTKQKLLYGPMGELLILQPDDAVSPSHDLLPEGSGLYLLTCSAADAIVAEKQMRAAKAVFLNSPHPLDILSDRAAYGAGGTIQRDHDMISYLKCVKNVIKEEEERNAKREQEHRDWWRNVASSGINIGIMHGAEESFKRFTRMVSSQRLHLIVVFLFPARLMILGALSAISFH